MRETQQELMLGTDVYDNDLHIVAYSNLKENM